MKIGIMGGTFDPIHNGHLMLGEYAYHTFGLDQVWFMPNGRPPHKAAEAIETNSEHRVEMVRLAISSYSYFKLECHEARRQTTSYSYETMEYFQKKYPDHSFYFIIGADSLFAIEQWKHPRRLLRTCTVLAAYRDDIGTKEAMREQIAHLHKKYGASIELLITPVLPISSQDIRRRLKTDDLAPSELPPAVFTYIVNHQLYQVKQRNQFDISGLRILLEREMDTERYEHTLGVMYTAAALAMRYNADVQKALLAGLLHDCAKTNDIPKEQQLILCQKYHLEISDIEYENQSLLHAKLGAYLAAHKYHVGDPEILSAIRWHTTGKPDMTLLEKIVYIADFMEPGRNEASNLAIVRKLAFENIDQCLYRILKDSLKYLAEKKAGIDPMTRKTCEYYQRLLKK